MGKNFLLNAPDGDPVRISETDGAESPFFLVGDHAGSAIPAALGGLGLSAADRSRHIALDIGVRELGLALGKRLGAPFQWQHFSRLVCDCNRHPDAEEWAPQASDGTIIPGNRDLSAADREARRAEIFEPYHAAIEAALAHRSQEGRPTIFVSLHSFTPDMGQEDRPWDVAVLHDGREDGFARDVLGRLRALNSHVVGDNQPYRMDDTDYTVPRHAYPRGLPYIEIEVRQDRLADPAGVKAMADLLCTVMTAAIAERGP